MLTRTFKETAAIIREGTEQEALNALTALGADLHSGPLWAHMGPVHPSPSFEIAAAVKDAVKAEIRGEEKIWVGCGTFELLRTLLWAMRDGRQEGEHSRVRVSAHVAWDTTVALLGKWILGRTPDAEDYGLEPRKERL